MQAAVPALGWIVVRVERNCQPAMMRLRKQFGRIRPQCVEHEIRANVQMARLVEQAQVDFSIAQRGNRAAVCQNRPIHAARENDAQTGSDRRVHHNAGNVDPALGQLLLHEPAKDIVANFADEGDSQAQPRRAARKNSR